MTRKFIALSAFAVALSACGNKQHAPIQTDPIYDKIGNATCPGGYRLATSESREMICVAL